MVCPDQERLLSPLQPMTPFHQGQFCCEQVSVPYVVVSFCRIELAGEICVGMELVIRRSLRQNSPGSRFRCIHLHGELFRGIRMNQNWGC